MSAGGAAGGAAAAGAAAAVAQAILASGAIIKVEPQTFAVILGRQTSPLVVHATGGFFSTDYRYLTPYRGLVFYTKSPVALDLPSGSEIVQAKKIWVPG